MKVLLVNTAYYIRGGQERYFFDLNRLLESQGDEAIPFSVKNGRNIHTSFEPYFLNHIGFFDRKGPLDYIGILMRTLYSFEAKKKITSLIEKVSPQMVHLHTIYHSISPSILPAIKKYGIPIVQTLSNFDSICPNSTLFSNGRICQACKDGLYLRAVLRRCHKGSFWASALSALEAHLHKLMRIYEKNIDTFIVPSRFMKSLLIDYGFDSAKLVYIPHFTDTSKYSPSYSDSGYFAYFGRLDEGKGLKTLIRAMKKVKGAKLYIVGEGPMEASLKKRVEDFNLSNVEFSGFQGGEGLKAILADSMFTVFPSEAHETFGLAIIESFAMGKPVVGSDLEPIQEIVDDGTDGLLFEPSNIEALTEKIQYLIDRPNLRRDMGVNARRKAETKYNPKDHYDKIKNLYNSLIKSKQPYSEN